MNPKRTMPTPRIIVIYSILKEPVGNTGFTQIVAITIQSASVLNIDFSTTKFEASIAN